MVAPHQERSGIEVFLFWPALRLHIRSGFGGLVRVSLGAVFEAADAVTAAMLGLVERDIGLLD